MNKKYGAALLLLIAALPLVLAAAAGIGAYHIPLWRAPLLLWQGGDAEGYRVLMYIRLPRVLLAALAGAALGAAGACLQGLFRNPLADPGLIGVTSGGAVGASLFVLLPGLQALLGMWGMPLAAFAGSAIVVTLVWRLARGSGRLGTATLLLAGIALNSVAGAALGLMIFMSDDEQLRDITFWQLGSMTNATWQRVTPAAPAVLAGLLLLLPMGRALNALALGEREAFHLGIAVQRAKRRVIIGVALAVGAAVSAVGGIGFIGLVAPHLLRLSVGADHRWLLPASALTGALLLVLADTLARTLVQPAEMPVGILTACLGGPFFIWLLLRHRKELVHA